MGLLNTLKNLFATPEPAVVTKAEPEIIQEIEENKDGLLLDYVTLYDNLDNFPKQLLTKEAMNQRNSDGDTVWHIAAGKRLLKDIPKDLFTVEALSQKNKHGNTVWHFATALDGLKDIPKELFTAEVLIKNLNNSDDTVLHIAVAFNKLKDIPKDLFTEEALIQKNKIGESVLYSVKISDLKHIPEHALTKQVFMAQSGRNGDSLAHICLRSKDFKDVPEHLITEDLLKLKNNSFNIFHDHVYEKDIKNQNKLLIQKNLLNRKLETFSEMPLPGSDVKPSHKELIPATKILS